MYLSAHSNDGIADSEIVGSYVVNLEQMNVLCFLMAINTLPITLSIARVLIDINATYFQAW